MSALPRDKFSFPANRKGKTASGVIKFTREHRGPVLVKNISLKAFFGMKTVFAFNYLTSNFYEPGSNISLAN